MLPFEYERVADTASALRVISSAPEASFVAGGTELLNWLKEGIARPSRLVDINSLPLAGITRDGSTLRIGALARMSDTAANADVRRSAPALAEALELSASPQLRNMASMGGNLMQRTRCPYFRAEIELPCNKRRSGSGCSAIEGENRLHAIFGWNSNCVATHASDAAVALAMLDAVVLVLGPKGSRAIPIAELYREPTAEAVHDTALGAEELITAIEVPDLAVGRNSRYLKLRERTSYEFALVSAAAGVEMDGERIRATRVALGGVAYRPWRLRKAELALTGQRLERGVLLEALAADFKDARPLAHNGFKVNLAQAAAARAIEAAGGRHE